MNNINTDVVYFAVGLEYLKVMKVNFRIRNIKYLLRLNSCWTFKIGVGLPALGQVQPQQFYTDYSRQVKQLRLLYLFEKNLAWSICVLIIFTGF